MHRLRHALMAVAVAGSAAAVVAVGTGSAAAATLPPHSRFLPIGTVSDLLVDPAHQRVLIADGQDGKLISTDYSGAIHRNVTGLPGVGGLALSADSRTLYAAVAGENTIVGFDAATLAETTRFS